MIRPKRCSWGFRGESCHHTTFDVFCRGHRAVLDQMIAKAVRATAVTS